MLTIALDYDGTYTAAPDLWQRFAKMAIEQGHRVITITARRDTLTSRIAMREAGVSWPIIFAYDKPKKLEALRLREEVAIWIDDNPQSIGDGTENLATQTVFEIELRHATAVLREVQAGLKNTHLDELLRRLQTVVVD